ncbi:TcfC E-set like domain-containing protein [Vibrio sp. nBUS_14]|uniref:TcfC E-set like domain-containing protein n=1 Tax=Vibrio sp. nBUS_14 TaxID=3395321 RepID=UPI003EB803F2
MFRLSAIFFCLLLPMLSQSSYSQGMLEGFEDLFEIKPEKVRLRNLDGSFTSPIVFLTSFNTIKLESNNEESISSIFEYLNDNSILDEYQQSIVEQLMIGVKDHSRCLGKLNECELYPETFEIVHNYNDRELYLYVSPNVLSYSDNNEEVLYHSSLSENNGLINSFDLYISDYQDQNSTISFNDQTTVGLPYGYLKSDFNLSNRDDSSKLYEAAYHLDVESYSIKAGHFEYDPEINSTDFLNNMARISQNSIIIGTSQNLLVGGNNNNKALSFYAPASGSVQVLRDDRLIFQGVVPEGQNSISYSQLPMGRYEVVLNVMSGGQVINTQTFQVYNARTDTLTQGDFDFVATGGLFSGGAYDDSNNDIQNIENDFYSKGLISYQFTSSILIGLGGLITESGSMYSIGGSYNMIDWGLDSEAVYNQFEEASYLNVNVGIPHLSLSYNRLDNQHSDPIASYIYGGADYSRLSADLSYNFSGGHSLYATYSLNQDNPTSNINSDNKQEQQFLSVGYSAPAALNSHININLDYSEATDDTSVSLLWSVPLSDTVETIFGLTGTDEEVNQFKTTLRRKQLVDSKVFNTSLEVSNTYAQGNNDMYQDAQLVANGTTKYASMNGTISTSTNGSNGFTGGLSSSQIATSDNVYVTDRAASSYTLVDIEQVGNMERIMDEKGLFSLKKEGRSSGKFIVYQDETIVPLEDYRQYRANFDSESLDIYNSGDSSTTVFTHPGTVALIEPKVSRVVSFVSAFNDISEQPILEMECHGEACIDVNEMTDGVYRVSVLEGMDFTLSSKESQCLLPFELTSIEQTNFGLNYCLPVEKDKPISLDDGEMQLTAVFLGAYQNSNKLNIALEKLESRGYRIIQKEIGNFTAIYLAHSSIDIMDSIAIYKRDIDELRLLAMQLNGSNAITYPVAQAN